MSHVNDGAHRRNTDLKRRFPNSKNAYFLKHLVVFLKFGHNDMVIEPIGEKALEIHGQLARFCQ